MALVTMVTMLALLEFMYFGGKVGAARGKYGISAPATSGNEQHPGAAGCFLARPLGFRILCE